MTQVLEAPPLDTTNLGAVGDRVLVAVQTFDIARLTTHAVPIVPGTFIAVTGAGPDGDSNGSGKTTFLGAVSLLLGEPQWRLASDGRLASGLLFKPESAGLKLEQGYRAADYGYVAGVFAASANDPAADAVTVWVRVGASAPYVRARWAPGLHVADADTDRERYEQADKVWSSLRANEVGARTMASTLYGDAPRCLAYLDPTVRKSAPSLLSQQLANMTPERIAESLIGLTGREHLIDTEAEQRRCFAEQEHNLAEKIRADGAARVNEAADLEGVGWRNKAREHLARGDRMWELHFARGLVEKLAEVREAQERVSHAYEEWASAQEKARSCKQRWDELRVRTDLAAAAAAAQTAQSKLQGEMTNLVSRRGALGEKISRLATRRQQLAPLRDGWDGSSPEAAQERYDGAVESLAGARLQREAAERDKDDTEQALRLAERGLGGPAGAAVSALRDEGIQAVAVLDVIQIDPQARSAWDPRLWPHREAVAVSPDDERGALEVLSYIPGATLVVADAEIGTLPDGETPTGVSVSQPLHSFLHGLAASLAHRSEPDRVTDSRLHESVIGGFKAEIVGQRARIGAAEIALSNAEAAVESARVREASRATEHSEAQAQLRAAEAVRELTQIRKEQEALDEEVRTADGAISELESQLKEAEAKLVQVLADKTGHDQQVTHARELLKFAEETAGQRKKDHDEAMRKKDALNLPYWQTGWGRPPEHAEQVLSEQSADLQRVTARSLRSYAAEALKDALTAYGYAAAGILPPELSEMMQRRRQLAEGFGGIAGDTVDFARVARPLRDLLDSSADADHILEERITRAQAERQTAIDAARQETGTLEVDLRNTQEAIAGRIDSALRGIAAGFNELDTTRPGGYGADLRIEQLPPAAVTDPMRWKVTPVWRRSPSGGMVSYQQSANTAQIKVAAIQLVLAALLATEGATGRVLILDELGDSLGDVNRKQVLEAVSDVARRQVVTILGTCQDSVIDDAASVCGEIMWFSHVSRAEVYNHPTRAWGFDDDQQRVTLVADWLQTGRSYV